MDINKKEILIHNFTPQRINKDILLINNINAKNSPNKNKLFINKKNKVINPNKIILEKNNNSNSDKDKNINNENNVNNIANKTLPLDKIDSLNEITLNSLAQENNLLKKEIEIVKSNLIISDEKEQLHKKTIQRIKKINKENEISYKNSINVINEYKKREFEYKNKINELETYYGKKEEELNNELSIIKKDLFNKNLIINDLNIKINHLNEQIIYLKKLIAEKNEIIFLLSKNNHQNFETFNNLNDEPTLATSKSCNNIISRKVDFKINKTEKNLLNLNNSKNYNSFKNLEKIKLNQIKNNLNNNNNKNNENLVKIIRENSYYTKILPNKTYNINNNNNKNKKNKNSLKIQSLKKYFSNKNMIFNSLNYSINKNPNMIYETNISNSNNHKNRKIIHFKKSFNNNKDIIKSDRKINDNIKEICIKKNKICITPQIRKTDKKNKRNNIIEFNNYSFFLNDIEKNQPNKLLYNQNEIIKNKKINNNYNSTIVHQISNKNIKPENIKGLYSKKNKLIEINKYFPSKNPSFISSISLGNVSPLTHKETPK